MKNITFISYLILFGNFCFSQTDTLNQRDANGLKQGYWVFYGIDKPDWNYSDSIKIEAGRYLNDRKNGVWIKYHADGKTIKLKGEYKNNRPDGQYFKYFANGNIKEIGFFHNNSYNYNLRRFLVDGKKDEIKTFLENGTKIDSSFYYFESGCLKSIEILTQSKSYTSKTINYHNHLCNILKDTIVSYFDHPEEHVNVSSNCTFKGKEIPYIQNEDSVSMQFDSLRIKNGVFNPNGFNKIYNYNDEVWQDGEFRNGKLWEGKIYIYDSDGILLKIKLFKDGEYYGEGQL